VKDFFISAIGFVCAFFPVTQRLRDMLLWPIASRALGVSYTKVVTLKNGINIKASMEDILNRFIMFLGPHLDYIWEPVTVRLLESLSKEKKSILIAGSHIGFTVLSSARITSGHIYAFEPVKNLFDRSKENFNLNPNESKKITLEKMALGDKVGMTKMYIENIRSSIIPYSGGHSSEHTEDVLITTIDTYAEEKNINSFDLIFLDIEGYELFALEGATKVLAQNPDLILEVSPRVLSKTGKNAQDLYNFLLARGYSIYVIVDDYKAELKHQGSIVKLIPINSPKASIYKNFDYFNIFATTSSEASLRKLADILK
jgi:FkbM family methyltransferase